MYKLLSLHRPTIEALTGAGIIDPHWLRDMEMFEEFETLNTGCKMCKYSIIADKYGLSEECVRKRIRELRR